MITKRDPHRQHNHDGEYFQEQEHVEGTTTDGCPAGDSPPQHRSSGELVSKSRAVRGRTLVAPYTLYVTWTGKASPSLVRDAKTGRDPHCVKMQISNAITSG